MHIQPTKEELHMWMVFVIYENCPDLIAAMHKNLLNHLPPDYLKQKTHLGEDLESTLELMVSKGYLERTPPNVIYRLTEEGAKYMGRMTSEEFGCAEDEIKRLGMVEFAKDVKMD